MKSNQAPLQGNQDKDTISEEWFSMDVYGTGTVPIYKHVSGITLRDVEINTS
jgi:hypothetical protein